MLKLKLLVAYILMQSSVFAWSQPTKQAQTSPPAAASGQSGLASNASGAQSELNAPPMLEMDGGTSSNVTGLACTVFVESETEILLNRLKAPASSQMLALFSGST